MSTDLLNGGEGNDLLYGRGGNDRIGAQTLPNGVWIDDSGRDEMHGGAGADTIGGGFDDDFIFGEEGDDQLNGDYGNDTVNGGLNNDRIFGWVGNDVLGGCWFNGQWLDEPGDDLLMGYNGDDTLVGGTGTDTLYGEADNDWLEAGAAWEFADGGAGRDYNAHVLAINGATRDDVRQLNSPTCSLAASIASVAGSGVNLASRITYLGNGWHSVGLYNPAGQYTNVTVWFRGDLSNMDLQPAVEGESWVTIMQRAYLTSRGMSVSNPPTCQVEDSLRALTGNLATKYTVAPSTYVDYFLIQNALQSGRPVVAGSVLSASMFVPKLVGTLTETHAYSVVGISFSFNPFTFQCTGTVTVRNPWGVDNNAGQPTSGDANDGYITLTLDEFSRGIWAYVVG